MNVAELQGVLRAAGWPATHLAIMSAIGIAESSGNPRAVNPGNPPGKEFSVGLWQINMKAHGTKYGTEEQLKDPVTNAKAALDIFRRQGFRAWGAYTDGRYKTHLAAAQRAAGGAPVDYNGGGGAPQPNSAGKYAGWLLVGAAVYLLLE